MVLLVARDQAAVKTPNATQRVHSPPPSACTRAPHSKLCSNLCECRAAPGPNERLLPALSHCCAFNPPLYLLRASCSADPPHLVVVLGDVHQWWA
jgi:hypothetical protein